MVFFIYVMTNRAIFNLFDMRKAWPLFSRLHIGPLILHQISQLGNHGYAFLFSKFYRIVWKLNRDCLIKCTYIGYRLTSSGNFR